MPIRSISATNRFSRHREPTRLLTIFAQDPCVTDRDGKILRARVEIPNERLFPGPTGYRVKVVDYDASSNKLYKPLRNELDEDFFAGVKDDDKLLSDPCFHAQNVYAIVMRTLSRFEFALGRRISWSFRGHQLHVAPHAFADANAFYSKEDWGLFLGYFHNGKEVVYTCLSYDVIAHETTHALVDGLRQRYTDPSSPDQAAFHEGFSDVVALLSVFSLKEVIPAVLGGRDRKTISRTDLTEKKLNETVLFGMADQMGEALSKARGHALRRSTELPPSEKYLDQEEFKEPHRRGEILVAAVMRSFLAIWLKRLKPLLDLNGDRLDAGRVFEEGSAAADHLLTMCIRALDYMPPTDVMFGDFLSGLLTADSEVQPDDSKYDYRGTLLRVFGSYGIKPASSRAGGLWKPPPPKKTIDYSQVHFESMQRDPDEAFRFIWENRAALELSENAFTRVMSVRPCTRVSSDGFHLRETVVEYIQMLDLYAAELTSLKIKKPPQMPDDKEVTLYGGGALIFDEFGRLKYHIHNSLLDAKRQTRRICYLWDYGFFGPDAAQRLAFSALHRNRLLGTPAAGMEEW